MVPVRYVRQVRLVVAKSKQRAVSILLFLGGLMVLVAAWDLPESPSPQMQ